MEWLKNIYYKFIEWLYPELKTLIRKIDENHEILRDVREEIIKEKHFLKKDLKFYKKMSEVFIDKSPDMMWLKDTQGKYIRANKAIQEGLLLDCEPIGKTDVEMATNAKATYGSENHTFGEVCANSDKIVLQSRKPQRFLEHGKVKGKMLYLEVYKFPFYDSDNTLVGIAGIGRDMTEYVEAFNANNCGSCSKMRDIFERYRFEE